MAVCLVLVMGMAMVFANGAGETSGTTTIRVLNYIDMSEPNSANEISTPYLEISDLGSPVDQVGRSI
ncbi:MAG: hypothetical protein SOT35_03275, partial [Bullifex sp.]|nr:hypothetical protein [Bullifex sp.]